MGEQLISLAGALMILGTYGAAQLGWMRTGDRLHSLLNAVGGLLVAVIAARAKQVGVVVLEGTWSAISLLALVRALRRGPGGRAGTD
jgi:hypothetical protein